LKKNNAIKKPHTFIYASRYLLTISVSLLRPHERDKLYAYAYAICISAHIWFYVCARYSLCATSHMQRYAYM